MPPKDYGVKEMKKRPLIIVRKEDVADAIRQAIAKPELEKILAINAGQKRTIKGLQKKLSKARIQFNRIMAETREVPDWYFSSDTEPLSAPEEIFTRDPKSKPASEKSEDGDQIC
jgi:nucleoside-diphosphate-sugar epimerase